MSTYVDKKPTRRRRLIEKDSGFAWVVCAGVFFMLLLSLGYIRIFGVLFVAFQEEFSSSASVTASIMGVHAVVYSITSLLACNIGLERFSARQIAITGGLLVAGGVALDMCAYSVTFLLLTNGIIVGIGNAMIYGPAIVTLGHYFDKRRTLAVSFAFCGACVGGIGLPPFVRFILDEYGVRGAMLIFGGVLLHVVPASMLLIPVEDSEQVLDECKEKMLDDGIVEKGKHLDKRVDDGIVSGEKPVGDAIMDKKKLLDKTIEDNTVVENRLVNAEQVKLLDKIDGDDIVNEEKLVEDDVVDNRNMLNKMVEDNVVDEEKMIGALVVDEGKLLEKDLGFNGDAVSGLSSPYAIPKFASLSNSLHDLKQIGNLSEKLAFNSLPHLHTHCEQSVPTTDRPSVEEDSGNDLNSQSIMSKIGSMMDTSLFKNRLFYAFIGFHLFGYAGIVTFPSFVPPIAKENGLTDVQGALLVSLHAGLDLCCRLTMGVIGDVGWFERHKIVATMFFLLGTVYQLVRLFNTFTLMILYVVVFGSFSGSFYSLHPSIAVDFFGKEKFAKVFGYVQFFHGVVITACYPIIGGLRDFTGNYAASCHFLGAGLYVAAIFLLIKPCLVPKQRDSP